MARLWFRELHWVGQCGRPGRLSGCDRYARGDDPRAAHYICVHPPPRRLIGVHCRSNPAATKRLTRHVKVGVGRGRRPLFPWWLYVRGGVPIPHARPWQCTTGNPRGTLRGRKLRMKTPIPNNALRTAPWFEPPASVLSQVVCARPHCF